MKMLGLPEVDGFYFQRQGFINSSPPSAAYMRQRIGTTLVQIMACRLSGLKPLPKPMFGCSQLDP